MSKVHDLETATSKNLDNEPRHSDTGNEKRSISFRSSFESSHGRLESRSRGNRSLDFRRNTLRSGLTVEVTLVGTTFHPLRAGLKCFKGETSLDKKYCFYERVSKNDFSEVWLARHRKRSKEDPIVIRLMEKGRTEGTFLASEMNVLKIMHNHPFIVQMHTCFSTADYYAIVMKFATRGSLHSRVKMVRCFSELVARFYSAQIALAIFTLHQKGIIHRDLNLDNILVCENGHVVISDFGHSKVRDPDDIDNPIYDTWLFEGKSRPFLPAPELYLGLEYDKTVDWWSFGVMLFRMVVGEFPFQDPWSAHKDNSCRPTQVQQVYRAEGYPQYLSKACKAFIQQLLESKRIRRLGSGLTEEAGISQTPFFCHVEWSLMREATFPAPFSEFVNPVYHREGGNKRAHMPLATSFLGQVAAPNVTTKPANLGLGSDMSKSGVLTKAGTVTTVPVKMSIFRKTSSWIQKNVLGEHVTDA